MLRKKPFENIVRKEENADTQHLLFPQCFLPFPNQISFVHFTVILSTANALNLDKSKILLFSKELKPSVVVTH